ncbi:MAG: metallophosphoesterase [Myxococcaceae bacterium]
MKRHLVLPREGRLLVSTDLHGNLRDFRALRTMFLEGRFDHWLVLGDLVHGPDRAAAEQHPALYGYPDESPALIDELTELRAKHRDRVHFVLGNHDAGHLGHRHTSKFHADEVTALEARLTEVQLRALRTLCENALLAVVAPCGLLFSHGSGGDAVDSLAMLDGPLDGPSLGHRQFAIAELLWCYGQRGEVSARLLSRISAETSLDLRVVVHGHDKDEAGWFVEGGNQVQPVIFGAPDENKRCLWLDLAATYRSPDDLREGHEVRRLHEVTRA